MLTLKCRIYKFDLECAICLRGVVDRVLCYVSSAHSQPCSCYSTNFPWPESDFVPTPTEEMRGSMKFALGRKGINAGWNFARLGWLRIKQGSTELHLFAWSRRPCRHWPEALPSNGLWAGRQHQQRIFACQTRGIHCQVFYSFLLLKTPVLGPVPVSKFDKAFK